MAKTRTTALTDNPSSGTESTVESIDLNAPVTPENEDGCIRFRRTDLGNGEHAVTVTYEVPNTDVPVENRTAVQMPNPDRHGFEKGLSTLNAIFYGGAKGLHKLAYPGTGGKSAADKAREKLAKMDEQDQKRAQTRRELRLAAGLPVDDEIAA